MGAEHVFGKKDPLTVQGTEAFLRLGYPALLPRNPMGSEICSLRHKRTSRKARPCSEQTCGMLALGQTVSADVKGVRDTTGASSSYPC